jgi:uncharacterized membrane protein
MQYRLDPTSSFLGARNISVRSALIQQMIARYRKLISDLREAFWVIPGLMVLAGLACAFGFVSVDHAFPEDAAPLRGAWLYRGGPDGARAVLGAIATSTIAVAGTVFSITIAALSMASGQMGPRLLHNFTRDRGNQITLGAFIGTFVYSLTVLRTVRGPNEESFVPHLSVSIAIVLAFVCVATLVWFVAHMAERINVDTVIDLVSDDVQNAIGAAITEDEEPEPPDPSFWHDAMPVARPGWGYLQQLDAEGLADWAAENGTSIRLLVRPGDYVNPANPIALAKPRVDGIVEKICDTTVLGDQRRGNVEIDYTIGQLVEVAVRALSAGINDPQTAISVIDRLGAALCCMAGHKLRNGIHKRDGHLAVVVPTVNYAGLVEAMFELIRQNARGQPVIFNKLLATLEAGALCDRVPHRLSALRSAADRILATAEETVSFRFDLDSVRTQHARVIASIERGTSVLSARVAD